MKQSLLMKDFLLTIQTLSSRGGGMKKVPKPWTEIQGKVKGKARPRFYNGVVFTPHDTVEYEDGVRQCYMEQDGRFHEGEVCVFIWAHIAIPKSFPKKRRQRCIDSKERPIRKPDLDNVAKIILDSLNGIAYRDDTQVTTLHIRRVWTKDAERVVIGIRDEFDKEPEETKEEVANECQQASLL